MLFIIIITCAILAIVGFIAADRTAWSRRERAWHWVAIPSIVAAVLAAIIMMVATWAVPIGKNGYRNPDTLVKTAPLVALNTGESTKGAYFFLGTGVVDDEPIFKYIVDSQWGAELTSIEAWRARVREGDGPPTIEYWAACDNWWSVPWPTCSSPLRVFNIPPGSILRDYEVTP